VACEDGRIDLFWKLASGRRAGDQLILSMELLYPAKASLGGATELVFQR